MFDWQLTLIVSVFSSIVMLLAFGAGRSRTRKGPVTGWLVLGYVVSLAPIIAYAVLKGDKAPIDAKLHSARLIGAVTFCGVLAFHAGWLRRVRVPEWPTARVDGWARVRLLAYGLSLAPVLLWGAHIFAGKTPHAAVTIARTIGLILFAVTVCVDILQRRTRAEGTSTPTALSRLATGATNFWFRPISANRMRLFERLFAITFIYYIAGWMTYSEEWLTTSGFHFSDAVMGIHFPDPLPLLTPAQLPYFQVLIFAAPIMVVLGLFRRVALALCFGCAVYIQLADINAAFTLNKLYIVFFMLLLLQPRAVEGADGKLYQSAWPTRIIQTTLLVQYSTAGICKAVHGDWMRIHDILYGHSVGIYRTELASWIARNAPHWTWIAQSKFALAFEVFAPLLFIKKFNIRVIGFVLGIGMHIVIAALMKDLIYFSLQMIAFYALFLPDSWSDWAQRKVPDLKLFGRKKAKGAAQAPAEA